MHIVAFQACCACAHTRQDASNLMTRIHTHATAPIPTQTPDIDACPPPMATPLLPTQLHLCQRKLDAQCFGLRVNALQTWPGANSHCSSVNMYPGDWCRRFVLYRRFEALHIQAFCTVEHRPLRAFYPSAHLCTRRLHARGHERESLHDTQPRCLRQVAHT